MKKIILSALIPLLMATSAAFGSAMISFDDNNGAATAGSYNSTDTFSFDVLLSFTNPPTSVRGYSLWLEVPTALAPFITITGESYFTYTLATDATATKTFTDSAGADSGYLTDKSASASGDLGAVTTDGSALPAPQTGLKVATITFSLSGAPAGIYTLQSTIASPKTSEATEGGTFTDFNFAQSQYTITVVPEPATLSLLGLGALGSFGLTALRARRRG
jgi:hypothetical protein